MVALLPAAMAAGKQVVPAMTIVVAGRGPCGSADRAARCGSAGRPAPALRAKHGQLAATRSTTRPACIGKLGATIRLIARHGTP